MNFLRIITLQMIIASVLFSCKEQMSDADRQAAREGTQSQEIKKIGDGEITALALERGNTIADVTQKTLGSTLMYHVENNGIEPALKYCNLNAYPLVDSLAKVYSAEIKRVTLKARNLDNKPDSIETELLEAYQYSIGQGDMITENIHDLEDEYLLYTKPILIGAPLCLQCHGKLGEELEMETKELLDDLYPGDESTNYSIAEFRGMWSIRLDKKSIVKSL